MYQIFTNKFYLISILKLFILSILAITTALWVLNSVSQTEESEHLAFYSINEFMSGNYYEEEFKFLRMERS